jgi:hypothetical protein
MLMLQPSWMRFAVCKCLLRFNIGKREIEEQIKHLEQE